MKPLPTLKFDSEGLCGDLPKQPPVAHVSKLWIGTLEKTHYMLVRPDELMPLLHKAAWYDICSYGYDHHAFSCQPNRALIGVTASTRPLPNTKRTEFRYLRGLHAKIILLYTGGILRPTSALVGSMNYVNTGLVECMMHTDIYYQVNGLYSLFNHLWEQGQTYSSLESVQSPAEAPQVPSLDTKPPA